MMTGSINTWIIYPIKYFKQNNNFRITLFQLHMSEMQGKMYHNNIHYLLFASPRCRPKYHITKVKVPIFIFTNLMQFFALYHIFHPSKYHLPIKAECSPSVAKNTFCFVWNFLGNVVFIFFRNTVTRYVLCYECTWEIRALIVN